jgi:hypothetical protein
VRGLGVAGSEHVDSILMINARQVEAVSLIASAFNDEIRATMYLFAMDGGAALKVKKLVVERKSECS